VRLQGSWCEGDHDGKFKKGAETHGGTSVFGRVWHHIPSKTEMRQIYSMLLGFLRRNVKLGGYSIKEAKIRKDSSG
jgi:hypothetical protein